MSCKFPAPRPALRAALLGIVLLAGCGQDRVELGNAPPAPSDPAAGDPAPSDPAASDAEKPLYALHVLVFDPDFNATSYVLLSDTPDVSEISLADAREFPGWVTIAALGGRLLVASEGDLSKATYSFPAGSHVAVIDEERSHCSTWSSRSATYSSARDLVQGTIEAVANDRELPPELPVDDYDLSVARETKTAPESAYLHQTEKLGRASKGTWAVSVRQVRTEQAPVVSGPHPATSLAVRKHALNRSSGVQVGTTPICRASGFVQGTLCKLSDGAHPNRFELPMLLAPGAGETRAGASCLRPRRVATGRR